MELFLYYLLRASVLMALFYGFYKLFLARSTFHNINRVLLVFIALTVSLLPLFRFNLMPEKKPEPVTGTFPVDFSSIPITEFVEPQPRIEIPWIQILIILFIVGFLFALIRYLIGLNQIVTIIRKSERQTLADNVVLCVTGKDISPFSWMKYIVLSRKELSADNRAVIRHEKAHIHLHHSWDMIFFDLFSCLFWFNPFSWLLRHEIQSVHEYQADEQVLLSGIDTKQYQLLLIRKSVGEYKFSLANNFRQRDLHKRITMMMKNKTNRRMKWNYAMGLPVLFLAMIALSVPKLNAKAMEKENNKTDLVSEEITVSGQVVDEAGNVIPMVAVINKDDNSGTVTDNNGRFVFNTQRGATVSFVMVNYKERKVTFNKPESDFKVVLEKGEGESTELITVRIKGRDDVDEVSDDQSKIMVSGFVKDNQGVIAGALVTVKGTNRGTVTDMQGQFMIKTDIGSTLLFSMIDYKTGEYKVENSEKNNLVVVLEPDDAVKVIGVGNMDEFEISGLKTGKGTVPTISIVGTQLGEKPLYIVDGVEVQTIEGLDPKNIESISVLKDASSTTIYGEEGRNGTVLITTKKGSGLSVTGVQGKVNDAGLNNEESTLTLRDIPEDKKPLIVIDGEKMGKDFELNSVKPEEIESISVLKYESAVGLYGKEGENGVIIITKKKGFVGATTRNNVFRLIGLEGKKPLILFDNKAITEAELTLIDQNSVSSTAFFESEEAVKRYGEKAKDGAVVLSSKKQSKRLSNITIDRSNEKVKTKGFNDRNTAIIIDGKLASKAELENMDSKSIRVINSDPIGNYPIIAERYNIKGKDRLIQVFTKN